MASTYFKHRKNLRLGTEENHEDFWAKNRITNTKQEY
jgi:hypothetical protein